MSFYIAQIIRQLDCLISPFGSYIYKIRESKKVITSPGKAEALRCFMYCKLLWTGFEFGIMPRVSWQNLLRRRSCQALPGLVECCLRYSHHLSALRALQRHSGTASKRYGNRKRCRVTIACSEPTTSCWILAKLRSPVLYWECEGCDELFMLSTSQQDVADTGNYCMELHC